jgi:glycosyltransferase involved in cell wall biosynthesis
MGKKNNSDKKSLPFVSVCTPTFNRRPFWEYTIKCFAHQNYPKDRMEWIIIDDGSDKIKDLVCDISQVKYYEYDVKMPLGKKRNLMHEKSKGDIIVYMDDDDYYPPERVSHAVNMLMTHPSALCAGASEIYIWFKHINKMFQFGPYGPNHATAGTFAFKRELLKDHRYDDNAALAEEKAFLKNYSVPFVQLEPKKTILVFSHIHNTFDKKKLLENGENDYQKTSPRSVDEFIKSEIMKEFYMEKIDGLLKNYEPGDPSNKPDVLKQIKEIEQERKNMTLQDNREQSGRIVLNQDGKQIVLNNEQIVQIIQSQQEQLQKFGKMLEDKDRIISNLESQSDIEIVQSQEDQLQILMRALEEKDRIITSFESQLDAYKVMNEKYSSIIVGLQKTKR